MLKRFAGLSALGLRDGPLAAGCVGTAGTEGGGRAAAAAAAAANIDDAGLGSDSESRVRDFERTDGEVGTSVKLPGAITDKLDDGKDAREARVDTRGLGLTLEPMTRGVAARRAEPWLTGETSPVFGERAADPITD